MRFMAPRGRMARAWRGIVLRLAPHSAWFRSRVNSGRLAEPASYAPSTPSPDESSLPRHGSVAPDVPLPDGGRLRDRLGGGWARLVPVPVDRAPDGVADIVIGSGSVFGRDRTWLIRPDGYIDSSEPI